MAWRTQKTHSSRDGDGRGGLDGGAAPQLPVTLGTALVPLETATMSGSPQPAAWAMCTFWLSQSKTK